jgi:hypothetical protein
MARRLIGWLLLPAADPYDTPGLGLLERSLMDWSHRLISIAFLRPRSHGVRTKRLTLPLRSANIAAISVHWIPEDREVVTTYLHLVSAMYNRRAPTAYSGCVLRHIPRSTVPWNSVLLSPRRIPEMTVNRMASDCRDRRETAVTLI